MTSLHKTQILRCQPKDLFDLVLDVESYKEFLPWCLESRIISRDQGEFTAELTVGFNEIVQKYISKVTHKIIDEHYIIDVEAISGPFKYLKNEWKFVKLDEGTKVDFFIDFKFKNVLFEHLVGLFFPKVVDKVIDAFEKRAL